jgi:BCD family chlorophyll transporter-like MFS transporter
MRLPTNLRLGLFHVGSAMVAILVSGVWNRVMIADLGQSAFLVSAAISMQFLTSPFMVYAGYESDVRPIAGYRRTPYILGGRILQLATIPLLAWAALRIHGGDPTGHLFWAWMVVFLMFILYGIGNSISGATYISLLGDLGGEEHKGKVVGVVWTMMILGFAISPLLFARLMPAYEPVSMLRLFILVPIIVLALVVIALWGAEKKMPAAPTKTHEPYSLMEALKLVLGNRQARLFLYFMFTSFIFMFSQDTILEPFGGDVFGLPAGKTTLFNAFWGTGVLAGMVLTLSIAAKNLRMGKKRAATVGSWLIVVSFVALSLASLFKFLPLVAPTLVLLGVGMGIFNVGLLAMMMDMSSPELQGTFMGLWSLTQALSRGLAGLEGGAVRDVALKVAGSGPVAYGAVFLIAGLGLAATLFILFKIDVEEFKRSSREWEAFVMEGSLSSVAER